jgi:hypothetical protein
MCRLPRKINARLFLVDGIWFIHCVKPASKYCLTLSCVEVSIDETGPPSTSHVATWLIVEVVPSPSDLSAGHLHN